MIFVVFTLSNFVVFVEDFDELLDVVVVKFCRRRCCIR